jgi:hypothetical protein
LAAERTLAKQNATWQSLVGIGASFFNSDPTGTRDGLNTATGSVGLLIGRPPHQAAVITGPDVDGAKVRAALIKLGAMPGTVAGRSGIVWGAEGALHLDAANQFGVGPILGQFDRAVIDPHAVYTGRYAADVQRLLGTGSHPLATDPVTQSTITCLGDVVAAFGVAGEGQSAGTELAAGVRRGSSAGMPQEVLCEVPLPAKVPASEQFVRSLFSSHPPKLPQGATVPPVSQATVSTGSAGGRTYVQAIVIDKPPVRAGALITFLGRGAVVP